MGRAEENKQQKKQNLMDAAFQLYTTKGVAHTSVSDIVQAAGIAKGTFYLYFRDKYDLQEQLIIQRAEQLFHHALDCSGYARQEEPVEQVIAIVRDIVEQLEQDHTLLRFIDRSLGWSVFSKALSRSQVDFLGVFRRILQARNEEQLTIAAYMVIELVGATCHSVILDGSPVPLDRYRPYLENAVRAVLGSVYREGGALVP